MKWLRIVLIAFGLLAVAPAARGDELKALQDEWATARQKWVDAAREARERGESSDSPTYPAERFRPRFRHAAEVYAGRSEAIPVLMWLIENGDDDPAADTSNAQWALQQLTRSHATDPAIREALPSLNYVETVVGVDPTVALFEKIIHDNPDKNARADAMLNLAMLDGREGEGRDDPENPRAPNKARLTMARKLYQSLLSDYADTPAAAQARYGLFELQHLQVGMKAPDFVGRDENGKEIRLSQFAGQVVMLDFWGFW